MIEITDISDSRIKEFTSLKQSALDKEYVVVESKNVFKKIFNKNIKIYKVFTTNESLNFLNENCTTIDFPIYTASNGVMKRIVGYKIHQGMMAVIKKPEFINLDQINGNIVVLNGLTSPENIGSIVRSCAAFGIDTIIIDEKTCSPYIRRCIRVSTGNIFNINVYKTSTLKDDLLKLRDKGYTVLSTANTPEAISVHNHNFTNKSIVIIGNEGYGVNKDILDLSHTILKIDIDDEVTSLNAAIAASIIFFQMKHNIS